MKNGFDLEMYGAVYKNCFINCSTYSNGDLQLSLYGLCPDINQIGHFADITLEQNDIYLQEDEIIVNNRFKPTLIPQLEKLGILKRHIKNCVIKNVFYPIYAINFSKVEENCYYLEYVS